MDPVALGAVKALVDVAVNADVVDVLLGGGGCLVVVGGRRLWEGVAGERGGESGGKPMSLTTY